MPDKDFSDRLLRVLATEAARIRDLPDPIEREHEARQFQQLVTPVLSELRHIRSQSIDQVLEEDERMTLRDLSLVMGVSYQVLHRLRHGADDEPEALAG